jgi:Zn-dependent protease with chaperone function
MNPMRNHLEGRRLGTALLAAAISALCVAFFIGCFYPYISLLLHDGGSFLISRKYNDISLMNSVELGFITAMFTLPFILALTLGIAWPLFRYWIRRGFVGLAVYIGGGIVIAMIGALVITAMHFFCDFLVSTDFEFAMLLIGICGPVAGFVVWWVLQRSNRRGLEINEQMSPK